MSGGDSLVRMKKKQVNRKNKQMQARAGDSIVLFIGELYFVAFSYHSFKECTKHKQKRGYMFHNSCSWENAQTACTGLYLL